MGFELVAPLMCYPTDLSADVLFQELLMGTYRKAMLRLRRWYNNFQSIRRWAYASPWENILNFSWSQHESTDQQMWVFQNGSRLSGLYSFCRWGRNQHR